MTTIIQRLPTPGVGAVLYPDAAMDAGTRGLIDAVDPWSWGGSIPSEGAEISIGQGPLNYPLAEDGWIEDAALAATALTFEDNSIWFTDAADRLTMPVGFKPTATDTHLGLVWWMKNDEFATGAGFNNRIFDVREDNLSKFGLLTVYTGTPGVVNAVSLTCQGAPSDWSFGSANPFTLALFDGQLHQFGYEVFRDGAGFLRQKAYLDGGLVADRGLVADSTGGWTDTGGVTSLEFGLPNGFSGSGLNGGVYRAMMQKLDQPQARTFAETVKLDYSLNAARLAA